MLFNKLRKATKRKLSPLIWSVSVTVFVFSALVPGAHAATFDEQINQLKQNSNNAAAAKQQLGAEAANLSGTIAALQTEIAALETQITKTTGKVDSLNRDIARAEADLAEQQRLLGLNVRELYTEQNITTLEMLASSKNFSHFVDQEQYRSSLQEKIDLSTKRIEKLMAQLESEKKSVENLLADQKAMQDYVNSRRSENARLLGLNQEQQQAFQNTLNANTAQIAALQKQQAALNSKGVVSQPSPVRAASSSAVSNAAAGTNYPWANVPFPNAMPDPWGMYKRQCVSYTAWKVASSGRHMPYWGGRGNAKLWDDNARRAGIAVDNNPRVGDVAVSNAGAYGHVMYVEAVHGDGTISISQYNAGWDGKYSEARRKTSGLTFIHF